MTPDPATPEGREELRCDISKTEEIAVAPDLYDREDTLSGIVRVLIETNRTALDALDAKDAEIADLRSTLAGRNKVVESCKALKEIALQNAHESLVHVERQHAEITRLNAKLTALRDGIKEVVDALKATTVPTQTNNSNYDIERLIVCRNKISEAGEKLAKLWRESDPQETPKA